MNVWVVEYESNVVEENPQVFGVCASKKHAMEFVEEHEDVEWVEFEFHTEGRTEDMTYYITEHGVIGKTEAEMIDSIMGE